MKTVELTVKTGLCSSCGICKSICPQKAITYRRDKGLYTPVLDSSLCNNCSLCAKVCPGLGTSYPDNAEPLEAVYGPSLYIYNAWSRNPKIRHVSASGGVVSTIVQELLRQKLYDFAFCIDKYFYGKQLKTKAVMTSSFDCGAETTSVPKSRYLPVSHEEAVTYIKNNPKKKVILIGTSCAIQGIRKLLKILNRDENQYLLIGLFCDKVFNYNVYDYFSKTFTQGPSLSDIHFKNKESGGWPGNMKFFFTDGSYSYIDKKERVKAKEYFMPERCLYCIDKLNVNADISLGDNYTTQNSSSLGSNTVIIRTEHGESAWQSVCKHVEFEEVDREKIRDAQGLDARLNNLYFGFLKEKQIKRKYDAKITLNFGLDGENNANEYERVWRINLAKLHAGEVYLNKPKELTHQMKLSNKFRNSKHPMVMAERIYYAIKRRLR